MASSPSGLDPSTEAALPDVDTPAKLAEVAAEEEAREEDALLTYEEKGGLDPPDYVNLPTADVLLEAPKDSATSGTSTGLTFPPCWPSTPTGKETEKRGQINLLYPFRLTWSTLAGLLGSVASALASLWHVDSCGMTGFFSFDVSPMIETVILAMIWIFQISRTVRTTIQTFQVSRTILTVIHLNL